MHTCVFLFAIFPNLRNISVEVQYRALSVIEITATLNSNKINSAGRPDRILYTANVVCMLHYPSFLLIFTLYVLDNSLITLDS